MRCEICGKYILEGKRVRVEGSIIVTCEKCSSYGEFVKKAEPYKEKKVLSTPLSSRSEKRESREEFEIEAGGELAENFSQIIRREREKRGMKQDDLGKKINESASLIHRLESGKFKPSPNLVRKIEKLLKIKLLKKQEKGDFQEKATSESGELTLGDLVVIKKKRKGEGR